MPPLTNHRHDDALPRCPVTDDSETRRHERQRSSAAQLIPQRKQAPTGAEYRSLLESRGIGPKIRSVDDLHRWCGTRVEEAFDRLAPGARRPEGATGAAEPRHDEVTANPSRRRRRSRTRIASLKFG